MNTHGHWTFIAYDELNAEGNILWPVTVEVVGFDTEQDALIAAKVFVIRKLYTLREFRECYSCGFQESVANSMDRMSK